MTAIVPRNTTIPVSKSQVFSTYSDNQTSVCIEVYEGERPKTEHNHLLGKFMLEGIPPAPRGTPQIEVKFELDSNGILSVTASDKGTGKSKNITITNDKGRLSKEEIDRMVNEAEKYRQEDLSMMKKIEAKNKLENLIFGMKSSLNTLEKKLSETDRKEVEAEIEKYSAWVRDNENASTDELEEKFTEFESKFQAYLQAKFTQNASTMGGNRRPTNMGGMGNMFAGMDPHKNPYDNGPKIDEMD
jgi:L1 cell adhesion molecule like protein